MAQPRDGCETGADAMMGAGGSSNHPIFIRSQPAALGQVASTPAEPRSLKSQGSGGSGVEGVKQGQRLPAWILPDYQRGTKVWLGA